MCDVDDDRRGWRRASVRRRSFGLAAVQALRQRDPLGGCEELLRDAEFSGEPGKVQLLALKVPYCLHSFDVFRLFHWR